jgi:hypothetical protein
MGSTIVRAGRPHVVARLKPQADMELHLRTAFQEATAPFAYREVMALSRALDVTPHTVYNWKYGIKFPRFNIAMLVIEWVKEGAPTDLESPCFFEVRLRSATYF